MTVGLVSSLDESSSARILRCMNQEAKYKCEYSQESVIRIFVSTPFGVWRLGLLESDVGEPSQ